MSRIRNTSRWGNSDVIMLKPSDKKDLNIEIGKDEVDIDDVRVIKHRDSLQESIPSHKSKLAHAHKREEKK